MQYLLNMPSFAFFLFPQNVRQWSLMSTQHNATQIHWLSSNIVITALQRSLRKTGLCILSTSKQNKGVFTFSTFPRKTALHQSQLVRPDKPSFLFIKSNKDEIKIRVRRLLALTWGGKSTENLVILQPWNIGSEILSIQHVVKTISVSG